jgi:hypothetical protein
MGNDNVITSFLDRRWNQLRGFSKLYTEECPVIWIGTETRKGYDRRQANEQVKAMYKLNKKEY